MFSRTALVLVLFAFNLFGLERQERVIAGSPASSLEVRHLILTGTNQEIGQALAEIARDRYGAKPEASRDPLRTRAARRYFEKNDPILYERMRGVAAAFGRPLEDDAFEYSMLGFTDLRAGCSIIHLPPEATTTKTSVVSRDYDYSLGNLNFRPLAPGMLHPTARPYLIELHPDRGYASIAMVAYDLLSGVTDGMNSEGLVVTLALDDEMLEAKELDPTFGTSVGLGVLQVLRLLLDTAANVDEAKEILLQTKQYYEYVPCHFLIADRHGKSFVWEYSRFHNKEYIVESPGRPLVMTNFTLNKHMDGDRPPTAELAAAVCKRYEYLAKKLAGAPISEEMLLASHRAVDAQAPVRADAKRPPVRTLWHALYYPEERRAKFSYYLGETEHGIQRSEYVEFVLGSTSKSASTPAPAPAPVTQPAAPTSKSDELNLENVPDAASQLPTLPQKRPDLRVLQLMKTTVTDADLVHLRGLQKLEWLGLRATAVTGSGLAQLEGMRNLNYINLADTQLSDKEMPALGKLAGITGLILSNTKITDAGLIHLKSMGRLTKLNLTGTAVTNDGVAKAKEWLPFWIKIMR